MQGLNQPSSSNSDEIRYGFATMDCPKKDGISAFADGKIINTKPFGKNKNLIEKLNDTIHQLQ